MSLSTVKEVLSALAGIPKENILDTMTLRYDLGLTATDLAPALRQHFAAIDELLLEDPAALVHDIELAVH